MLSWVHLTTFFCSEMFGLKTMIEKQIQLS